MHHIAIQTGDSPRSAEFYRKLFGEPIETQGNPSAPQPIFLAGETRIILYNPAAGKTPKIDHFSVLVDNFDAPNAVKTAKSLGANGAVLSRQGTFNEFFDPGLTYGATPAKKYCLSFGGAGQKRQYHLSGVRGLPSESCHSDSVYASIGWRARSGRRSSQLAS